VRKIRYLKRLDAVLGRLLVALLPRPKKTSIPRVEEIESVLFIRPGGIGDAVLLVPTIRRLAALAPAAKISVLAEKRNAAVFEMCEVVTSIRVYDRCRDLFSVLGARFGVVIDSEQSHYLSALVARVARSQVKIGYATNARRKCFHFQIPYQQATYEMESFDQLLAPFAGGEVDRPEGPFLKLEAETRRRARSMMGVEGVDRVIALFPGASIPERRWSSKKFRALACELVERGMRVVVIGGREDRQVGEQITAGLEGAVNLAGDTTLVETTAVIEASSVLVSGDSGVLHLAVGLSRPAVALFGPGIKAKWAPRGRDFQILDRGLPCSPCTRFGHTPVCRNQVKCLEDIDVPDVLRALTTLLREGGGDT